MAAEIAAPQHDLDAREQLDSLEGLDDVILRAAAQALDLVGDRAERREEDDGRLAAPRADRIEHGEAVGAGQHHVEQNQVVIPRCDALDGLEAVAALRVAVAADRERRCQHF